MIGSIGGRVTGPDARGLSGIQARDGRCLRCVPRRAAPPSGIAVVLIEPGAIATPIWDRGSDAGSWIGIRFRPRSVRATRPRSRERDGWHSSGATKGLPPQRSRPGRSCVPSHRQAAGRPSEMVVGQRDAAMIAAMVRVLPFRTLYPDHGGHHRRISTDHDTGGRPLVGERTHDRPGRDTGRETLRRPAASHPTRSLDLGRVA